MSARSKRLNRICPYFRKRDVGDKVQATIDAVQALKTIVDEVKSRWNGFYGNFMYGCLSHSLSAIGSTPAKAKTTAPVVFLINGTAYYKAATDDLWTLTGLDCTNGNYSACYLYLDSSGTASIGLSSALSAASSAATLAGLPALSGVTTKCAIAILQVHPTGTGNFTGATTALNDGTVVPNATFTELAWKQTLIGSTALISNSTATSPTDI